MPRDKAWYLRKCQAFQEGYQDQFGKAPSKVCTALAVSVAIHETAAGDAWPGEHNWGATTWGSLKPAEQWILATEALGRIIAAGLPARGDRLAFDNFRYRWQRLYDKAGVDVVGVQRALGFAREAIDGKWGPMTQKSWDIEYPGADPEDYFPSVDSSFELNAAEALAVQAITPTVAKGHAARAAEAMAVLRKWLEPTGYKLPPAAIHCDSTPERGAYFVWFAAFDSDRKGAGYFAGMLARLAGPPALETDPLGLATAMYDGKYYTGFHKRGVIYPDGKDGRTKNIEAYAKGIAGSFSTVLKYLG